MKKIIIHKRDDTGAPVLVSMVKALFPECEVEVCTAGKPSIKHNSSMENFLRDTKEEERR